VYAGISERLVMAESFEARGKRPFLEIATSLNTVLRSGIAVSWWTEGSRVLLSFCDEEAANIFHNLIAEMAAAQVTKDFSARGPYHVTTVAYSGDVKTKPTADSPATAFNESGKKYLRNVVCNVDGKVDVYAVLEAFDVKCGARQHAIKKLLCSGIRGKGSCLQDLREARDAVERAIQMEESREAAAEVDRVQRIKECH
jgi:hypothetical protein